MIKRCIKCNLDKPVSDFKAYCDLNKAYIKRKCNECYKLNKDSIRDRKKIYYENNKWKILAQKKIYNKENKLLIKEKRAAYYESNKQLIINKVSVYKRNNRDSINERERARRKNDPIFKIRESLRSTIKSALRGKKNNLSINNFLNYSMIELKQHIENKFESWMSWNNQGLYNKKTWDDNDQSTWTWQLDHIIPQSDSPYTSMEDDNFKRCWALDNLRPYSAKQNIIDGASRIRHGSK